MFTMSLFIGHSINYLCCPYRVLAQMAKTRGSTLEAPTYREEDFSVAGKISIFKNMARKGLPKSTQRIAESSLGVEKHMPKDCSSK